MGYPSLWNVFVEMDVTNNNCQEWAVHVLKSLGPSSEWSKWLSQEWRHVGGLESSLMYFPSSQRLVLLLANKAQGTVDLWRGQNASSSHQDFHSRDAKSVHFFGQFHRVTGHLPFTGKNKSLLYKKWWVFLWLSLHSDVTSKPVKNPALPMSESDIRIDLLFAQVSKQRVLLQGICCGSWCIHGQHWELRQKAYQIQPNYL